MIQDTQSTIIIGIAISLISNNEFSEERLQDIVGKVFSGNVKYNDFFESIEQIEKKAYDLIMKIQDENRKSDLWNV
jgi:hypothetical protein